MHHAFNALLDGIIPRCRGYAATIAVSSFFIASRSFSMRGMARRRNAANPDHATPADIKPVGGGAPPARRVPLPLARHFFQICAAASPETVAEEGLKSGQFAILAHLSSKTGEAGIDQNGIAARMGVDRARVSQLAEELEAMGLIDRRVNGADRRARVLRLTPRGEQVRARLQPAVLAGQSRLSIRSRPTVPEIASSCVPKTPRSP